MRLMLWHAIRTKELPGMQTMHHYFTTTLPQISEVAK